jgi:L-ascorbate metabolism protein UlaG (beta-lactamase superfamily)
MKMTIFIIIIALIAIGMYAFLQTDVFGQLPEGEDLARIQKSPHYKNGQFENQSFTPELKEGYNYWDILKAYLKKVEEKEPSKPIPSVKTDLKKLNDAQPQIVWFGHSSYLLRTNGKNILADPVLSGNASPVSFFGKSYEGSNVYGVADMPDVIDVLLISHDHYDHLDYQTVKALQPRVKQVITSLGVGSHLKRWGYTADQITELDWDDSTTIDNTLKFIAQPARHFSGRGLKRNQAFWSSFVVQTPTHNFFLGGDSGYDSHFKTIGEKYGPFDLAILECGQYNDMWYYIHMMPEEVALAATDLKAKLLLPVHWGKFTLALHPWYESIERVTKKAAELNQPIITPMIGQPSQITNSLTERIVPPNSQWWKNR